MRGLSRFLAFAVAPLAVEARLLLSHAMEDVYRAAPSADECAIQSIGPIERFLVARRVVADRLRR